MTIPTLAQTAPNEKGTEHPHITSVNGVPILRGSRIPVRLVAQMYRAGDSVEDILLSYPHLTAAAVHDAVSYYLDHRDEIEREITEHRVEVVLKESGAQMDERGFITFKKPTNG
ncbi:MAG: DUF433 domain-containing protein [Chloroflexi bacterium]|nr:DUF433 domain-containing protein [Chloroflexota bacterium]